MSHFMGPWVQIQAGNINTSLIFSIQTFCIFFSLIWVTNNYGGCSQTMWILKNKGKRLFGRLWNKSVWCEGWILLNVKTMPVLGLASGLASRARRDLKLVSQSRETWSARLARLKNWQKSCILEAFEKEI